MENQRIRLTKTLLKDALIHLMKEKSFLKITVKDICTSAGINRSTFYLHYYNQFKLRDEIEEEILDEWDKYSKQIVKVSDIGYFTELLTFISENKATIEVLMINNDSSSFLEKHLQNSFQNLQLDLHLNCDSNIKDYIFGFLTNGCLSMMQRWLATDMKTSPYELAQIILDLCNDATARYRNKKTSP